MSNTILDVFPEFEKQSLAVLKDMRAVYDDSSLSSADKESEMASLMRGYELS